MENENSKRLLNEVKDKLNNRIDSCKTILIEQSAYVRDINKEK
jgi:hypothetical protein